MIHGIGTDICDIRRIQATFERQGERFVRKVLSDAEFAVWQKRGARWPQRGLRFLATRFSAQEAFSKAIGLGRRLPQTGRSWWDIAKTTVRNMGPLLITNGVLLGVLAALGQAWLYTAWLVAFFCWLPLFVRIRSIAEHGCLPRSRDMFLNTRTTRAGWLARMTVAPVHVNYHLEHHVMASVPYYRLPQMHRWLREKHAAPVAPSYLQVLKLASSGRHGAAA